MDIFTSIEHNKRHSQWSLSFSIPNKETGTKNSIQLQFTLIRAMKATSSFFVMYKKHWRTNVRVLNFAAFFYLILNSTLPQANAADLVSAKNNYLCLQSSIYIKLGQVKTTEAVLDFKIFFTQFNSYPNHFTRTTRNPTELFSIEEGDLNYSVGDVFPSWETPLKTSISKISTLSQSDGSITLTSYNPLSSSIRWEIVTTFKKVPMYTRSNQQLMNNIIELKIRLSQFNYETLNWETYSENEIRNLESCQ